MQAQTCQEGGSPDLIKLSLLAFEGGRALGYDVQYHLFFHSIKQDKGALTPKSFVNNVLFPNELASCPPVTEIKDPRQLLLPDVGESLLCQIVNRIM